MASRRPPADTTAEIRNTVRDFVRDAEEAAKKLDSRSSVPGAVAAEWLTEFACGQAGSWPSRTTGSRYLREAAGAARRQEREPDSVQARFWDRLSELLDEAAADWLSPPPAPPPGAEAS